MDSNKVFTNIIVVVCFFTLVIIVYNLFIKNTKTEPFENKKKKDKFDNVNNKMAKSSKQTNTIYEKALTNIYGDNKRLICSMVPIINDTSNICKIDNIPYIIYKFPIHIIKLIDDSILAVFNDGRMYQKYSMESTIWKGPIVNSMPSGTIPLRMVTLGTDLTTLYGVGYDNILYVKEPINNKGNTLGNNNTYSTVDTTSSSKSGHSINLTAEWKQVPNNSGIIYVLFDNRTNFLISININGKLFTKTSADITTNNQELVTLLDRPVLRLYYDLNGYMLAIDNKFDMYQFTDIDWKTTPLQLSRGANSVKIHDILYDNDGKLFGLVFNTDSFMVQIMKQTEVFYLAEFSSLDMILSQKSKSGSSSGSSGNSSTNNFVMSYQDIMKAKIGSISDYTMNHSNDDDSTDNDTNFAYQKQVIESKSKLVQFCNDRSSNTTNINYENYELLADVENNDDKISKLKNVITSLMEYEPERMNIQDKYPILNM